MRSVFPALLASLAAAPALAEGLAPQYWESYGKAELEATLYPEAPQFAGQDRHGGSVAVEPSLFLEWLDGDLTATVTGFARLDFADDERTHVDLREAKLQWFSGDWTVTAGMDKVFWGKTEAFHLVDIINQTDAVEGIDDEEALGQPMLRVSRLTDFGTFTAFWLPVFRERTFAGVDGRLRPGLPVDEDQEIITPGGDHFAQSGALRYDGVFGDADIGLSVFHGVSRDPSFVPTDFLQTPQGPVPTALAPVYTGITQFGFDGQFTDGPTLYKGEAIFRMGQRNARGVEEDYFAATGGLEHTLFGFAKRSDVALLRNADLGLIAEYAIDSRGRGATVSFQNDIVVGARLALNDTADSSLLLTSAIDHETGAAGLRIEAQTRVAAGMVAEIEGQFFINGDDEALGPDLKDDSFVRLKLSYYW